MKTVNQNNSNLNGELRREKILEMIQEDGHVKVTDLSTIFKVSEVTIRQDLERLDNEGSIIRQHGGAYLKSVSSQVRSFSLQQRDNTDKKTAIGKKAAQMVNDGDTIILDSGTTITEMAKNLTGKKELTVITNALNIAVMLGSEPSIHVIMTGGEFKAPTLSLTGEKAAGFFHDLHVDKLFLATAGISLKAGLTYPSISDLVVKKAMIDAADTIYLLADSTKIGKSSLASLGALALVDFLITDSGIQERDKKIFSEHEVEFIMAE